MCVCTPENNKDGCHKNETLCSVAVNAVKNWKQKSRD